MKLRNILLTGCCGFIGFSLSLHLLKKKKFKIYGIDNLDNYYSVSYKKRRLKELKKYKNFYFSKINLNNKKNLSNYLKTKKIDYVYHLCAQAGVRYSLINQQKYFDSNILGFFNLIETLKHKPPKIIFFASSSSVYGDSKKFPSSEKEILNPKNIYSLSKKINEQMAEIYSKQYKLKIIGLRFFTVFGEWGRPDMFLFKFYKSFFSKKCFFLNNSGNHDRDFTYIGDVLNILDKLFAHRSKLKNFDVFNICANRPLNLKHIISFYKKLNVKPKIKNIKLNKADVIKTHGSNLKIKNIIGNTKYTSSRISLKKTYEWYKDNRIFFND